MERKTKIKVENLYKIFGHNPRRVYPLMEQGKSKEDILEKTGCTVAINNVSFEIKERETFVVMGLSGSGKSTMIRCFNRLIDPTNGHIYLDGEDLVDMDMEVLRGKTALCHVHGISALRASSQAERRKQRRVRS